MQGTSLNERKKNAGARTPFNALVTVTMIAIASLAITGAASAQRAPSSSKVWVTDMTGVDAKTGSIVLRWAAVPGHPDYVLPGGKGCTWKALGKDSIKPWSAGTSLITTSAFAVAGLCTAGPKQLAIVTAPVGKEKASLPASTDKFVVPSAK